MNKYLLLLIWFVLTFQALTSAGEQYLDSNGIAGSYSNDYGANWQFYPKEASR